MAAGWWFYVRACGVTQTWCKEQHGMPDPPYAPHVKAWTRGVAGKRRAPMGGGEILYNANEVEPHLALELTERLVRLALATPSNATDAEVSRGCTSRRWAQKLWRRCRSYM